MSNPNLSQGDAGLAPSSSIDPNEYAQMQTRLAELENYQRESQEVFDQLKPHSARIKRIVEDETAARLFDDSLASYEALQSRSKPKLSDEWNPENNPYVQKIEKMYEVVNKFEERSANYEKQQQEDVNQRMLAENTKIAEQLIEKYPHLRENNFSGIAAINNHAVNRKIPFEAAARELEPMYRRESAEPTLRPEVGAPGIPGNSEKGENVDMVQRAAQLIRDQQRKAGMIK